MSCVASITLKDSNGVFWSFTIDDNGLGHTTQIGAGPASSPRLQEVGGSNICWDIRVTTAGLLQTVAAPNGSTQKQLIQFDSTPGNLPYQIVVTRAGLLQSIGPQGASVVVGQLLKWPPGPPYEYDTNFAQPGGPGTPVVPAQQIGELTGRYHSGCGHALNSWNVVQWTLLPCVTVKLVLCPICSWCQMVINPASLFDNDPTPLVA